MATLNIGIKIAGGGTVNTTHPAGTGSFSTNLFSTSSIQYAKLTCYIDALASVGQVSDISLNIGGVSVATASANDHASNVGRVGDTNAAATNAAAATANGQLISVVVPPSTTVSISGQVGSGSGNTRARIRGSYVLFGNTQ